MFHGPGGIGFTRATRLATLHNTAMLTALRLSRLRWRLFSLRSLRITPKAQRVRLLTPPGNSCARVAGASRPQAPLLDDGRAPQRDAVGHARAEGGRLWPRLSGHATPHGQARRTRRPRYLATTYDGAPKIPISIAFLCLSVCLICESRVG